LLTIGNQELFSRPDSEIERRHGTVRNINIVLEIQTLLKDKSTKKYLCISGPDKMLTLNNEELSNNISLVIDNVLVASIFEVFEKVSKKIKTIKFLEKALIKEIENLESEMKGN
jgi:hypothetical protein